MMDLESELCGAIEQRRVITITYNPPDGPRGERVCQPHAVYPGAHDNLLLDAWQTEGVTSRDKLPAWGRFDLDRIESLVVHDEQFEGSAPGYNPTGDRYTDAVCVL